VNVNGIQMPENLATVDDFSNKNRTISSEKLKIRILNSDSLKSN